jgi:hypothetical protein
VSAGDAVWDRRYPDQTRLRQEIDAMARAFVDALLEVVPRNEIAGIYLKGSTRKLWDSPLDYVPELSDVDVHLLFADDGGAATYLGSIERALSIAGRTEHLFRESVAEPVHLPRLQLVIANQLHVEPGYVPSPPETVEVILGKPYPVSEHDSTATRESARSALLEQEPYLASLGQHIADKPGRYLWSILHMMNWRVSPTGPRVLELLHVPYSEAWSMNRTAIAARLRAEGEEQLAADYAAYYLHAWEYFLSGYGSGEEGRAAVLAGARVLAAGVRMAKARAEEVVPVTSPRDARFPG